MIVIRTWHERGSFRARMIMQCDDEVVDPDSVEADAAQVIVTDSVNWLCDSLRAFLTQRSPSPGH